MYGVGFKPPLAGHLVEGTRRFLDSFPARLERQARQIGWQRLRRLLTGWMRSRSQRRQWRDDHGIRFAVHLCVDESLKHELLPSCSTHEKTGGRMDLID